MDGLISRSEKKRRAKNVEQLVRELVDLSRNNISRLDCDSFLQKEIAAAKRLKGGARKRQIKYIAKELRNTPHEPLLLFLQEKKGSKLKKNQEFHDLERLRDIIINDALAALKIAEKEGVELESKSDWDSQGIDSAHSKFPNLDKSSLRTSAHRYARTRNPAHSREIFRALKAASEQKRFAEQARIEGLKMKEALK
ncbi:MAG: ribosome biogenesis factor YjgA [Thermodesulfobacteriota bacterium]|nr:ribosome biogenesis factor YjgA [Thermodesulfobacteriota bacterium]